MLSLKYQYIHSLLLSSHPAQLIQFYETYGVQFQSIDFPTGLHYVSLNTPLSIVESKDTSLKNCLGGLIIYKQNTTTDNNRYGIQSQNLENLVFIEAFISEKAFQAIAHKTHALNWISILRHTPPEILLAYYKTTGDWIQEKHGEGPVHYSLTENNHVFEIYPLRKNSNTSMEYIVVNPTSLAAPVRANSILYDPEGRRIQLAKQ